MEDFGVLSFGVPHSKKKILADKPKCRIWEFQISKLIHKNRFLSHIQREDRQDNVCLMPIRSSVSTLLCWSSLRKQRISGQRKFNANSILSI